MMIDTHSQIEGEFSIPYHHLCSCESEFRRNEKKNAQDIIFVFSPINKVIHREFSSVILCY